MAVIDQLKLTEAQILTIYHKVNFDLEEAVLQLSLQLDQMGLGGGAAASPAPSKKNRGPLTKLDSDQSKKDLDLLQGMFSEKAIKELQQLYNKFKGNVDEVVQHILNQSKAETTAKKSPAKSAKKANKPKSNANANTSTTTTTTPKTNTTTTKAPKQPKTYSQSAAGVTSGNKQRASSRHRNTTPQTITLDPNAYPIFACTKPEQPPKKKTSSKFNWDRQCYLQWEHSQWEEFNATLNQVKSIFPNLANFTMIHSLLKNQGDLNQTLECCCQTCEYIDKEGISDTDNPYNVELEKNCDGLLDMFPTFTRFQIVLILIICQNNVDTALQSLLDMQYIQSTESSSLPSQSSSQKKKPTFIPAPDLIRAQFSHGPQVIELVAGDPHDPFKQELVRSLRHSSRELMDDPDIYRERAQEYYEKRNDYYGKAADRFIHRGRRNNHSGIAFYYAQEGRELERKAQVQNELAVKSLINEKLANRPNLYEIDLHGFRVQEAINFALEEISVWYIRDMKRVESGRSRKLRPLTLVTGVGHHNADGKSRILPALVKRLRADGWKIEVDKGLVHVLGTTDSPRS